jgi:hypothetical protein
MLSSYGLHCRWYPNSDQGETGKKSGEKKNFRVIMGLTLYKVQHAIYLLDFQRKEGDQFSFMTLCAMVISQLKILSATTKVTQVVNSDGLGETSLASEAAHQIRLPPVHPMPMVPVVPIPPYHKTSNPPPGLGDPYNAPPDRFEGTHVRKQEI